MVAMSDPNLARPSLPELDLQERARYSRHILLGAVGEVGQRRLKAARVLIVGTGGLGAPAALYLAAAGVGRIGLVDFDVVDVSNLQRQILFETNDLGRLKSEVAAERLRARNPHIEVVVHPVRLDASNALDIAADYDLIVDGADNFATRYLTNDLAVLTRKPLIYGAIFQFDGQATIFAHPGGPCYRCLYPEPPPPELAPNCAEAGVLGVLPGLIGLIQATEALKLILGEPGVLVGRLLTFDALAMSFRELFITRDPACPACGDAPSIRSLADTEATCAAITHAAQSPWDLTPADFENLRSTPHVLIDVRSAAEAAVETLGGTLIPLDVLPEHMSEIPNDSRVIIYCQVGRRSARAVEMLRAQGRTDVWNLRGGLVAWRGRQAQHQAVTRGQY